MLQRREYFRSDKLRGVNLAADETKLQVGAFTVLTNWIPDGVTSIKKKRGISSLDEGTSFTIGQICAGLGGSFSVGCGDTPGDSGPPGGGGEGEGGDGEAGADLFFANNGKTSPWYASSTYPAAIYVAATDTTWFTWESYSAGRRILVMTYNHTTTTWSNEFLVGTHSLSNDDHGVPAIERDHQGHIHCFYGAHNGAIIESVTNAPDDPSAWTVRHTFSGFANGLAYPHPVQVGSTLYLIARIRFISSSSMPSRLFKTTSLSGGIPTWSSDQQLVHYSADSRIYVGPVLTSGTDIHFVATRANFDDTFRRDIHHYILNTITGSVRNADGSTEIAEASLPVSVALGTNNDFIVASTPSTLTQVPAFCIDTAGNLHIAYIEGTSGTFDVKHVMFNGSVWSSPETVFALTSANNAIIMSLVAEPAGVVTLYYPEDEASNWARGGNIASRSRTSGGTWGSATTILEATSYALEQPLAIRNGHADARVAFCEIAGTASDLAGGDLKLYAYGDSGFL